MDLATLAVPAFIAGIITFLAPCTLPLVPAFLGFIGGTSASDLDDKSKAGKVRRKVMTNAILYVLGFSAVFITMGLLFGLGGSAITQHRALLTRIGGVFIIIFGLYMMNVIRPSFLKFLQGEHRFRATRFMKPGKPISSFVFGATFALGWSPCVGPILGSVLLLATASATAAEGSILLLIFSAGLALPFLLIAYGYGRAADYTKLISRHLGKISVVGGVFLVALGFLMVIDQMDIWIIFASKAFTFINYDSLIDYL